jgi:peptidoglycan hydrolase-like protein with peptidoglycan-binding domain
MGRTSGLALALTGTASVCVAFALQSSTVPDHTAALVSGRSDIVKGSRGESGRSLALAPDGWRAFRKLVNPSELTETVVVITAPRAKATVRATIAPATPATRDRDSLVRELQRELRRVGCYDGTLNGSWTVSTRSAMKVFTNRVNAALPTKEPDQILLALVKGHHGRACGTCPNGQSLVNDGRCLPNVILAQTRRKALQSDRQLPAAARPDASAISHQMTVADISAQYPDKRSMSLGGPLEKQAEPSGELPAAVVYAPRQIVVPPRQKISRHKSFGPEFFRRIDALGVN